MAGHLRATDAEITGSLHTESGGYSMDLKDGKISGIYGTIDFTSGFTFYYGYPIASPYTLPGTRIIGKQSSGNPGAIILDCLYLAVRNGSSFDAGISGSVVVGERKMIFRCGLLTSIENA